MVEVGQVIWNIFVSVILVGITLTFFSIYKKRKMFEFAKSQGGPTFYPFIGNAYAIIGKDVVTGIDSLYKKYSLPCNLWIVHDYTYVTNRASDANIVLNHPKCFEKSNSYNVLNRLLGNSLLLINYDVWKVRRKHMSKSFSPAMLRTFVPAFYRRSMMLIETLKNIKKDVNRFEIFESYSFDGFCETNIGSNFCDGQSETEIKLFSDVQSLFGKLILEPYIPFPLWKILTKPGRKLKFIYDHLSTFIFKMLQEKREILKANEEYLDKDALPLTDLMILSEGIRFSNYDIFDELLLFSAAATDTTGCVLTFTCMLLGMYLSVQDKVYEEVMEVVGDREICYEDLVNLKYIESVIQESMRLIPVAPVLGRLAQEDIDLGDKVLPKNSNVIISIFHIHRSEKYWKDPLTFNPDRFSPENISKIVRGSYVPFSDGIRNCIGKNYAMMSMKVVVANVVRNFRLKSGYKSVNELTFSSSLTLKATHNLDIDFIPRSK